MSIEEKLDKIIELLEKLVNPLIPSYVPEIKTDDGWRKCGIHNGDNYKEISHIDNTLRKKCNVCQLIVREGIPFACPNR